MKLNIALFVLLVCIFSLGAARAAFGLPKTEFIIPFTSNELLEGIFTGPRGAGDNSPIVAVFGGGLIKSYTATGEFLHSRDVSQYTFFSPPLHVVMQDDAKNNTVLVVGAPTGYVLALDAMTLETKWIVNTNTNSDLCQRQTCAVNAVVYVEQEMVSSCSNGTISAMRCDANGNTCSLVWMDFESGSFCQPHTSPYPWKYTWDSGFFHSIPSGGNGGRLSRPTILFETGKFPFSTEILYGIDAATGSISYQLKISEASNFWYGNMVSGNSPTNELFSYFVRDEFKNEHIVFRNVADGTERLRANVSADQYRIPFGAQWSWSASHDSPLGSVSTIAYVGNTSVILTCSAFDGNISVANTNATALNVPLVNFGNTWTVGMYSLKNGGESGLQGIRSGRAPSSPATFNVILPSSSPWEGGADGAIFPLTFSDGSAGLAARVMGSSKAMTMWSGFITVFRLL